MVSGIKIRKKTEYVCVKSERGREGGEGGEDSGSQVVSLSPHSVRIHLYDMYAYCTIVLSYVCTIEIHTYISS